jgi:hypothetical protein
MTHPLPPALDQAFLMAAGELGMCSAARLFVRELAGEGGDALVAAARDRLGRAFPVFDFVAARFLDAERAGPIDPSPVLEALAGIGRLLIVGLEADFLDALVPRLEAMEIGLITEAAGFELDLRRVLANFGGRVKPVDLSSFQAWAGRRSALLTFVYGTDGHVIHVSPSWLRVAGPDARTQFRSILGWDILGRPLNVYPRWLVEGSRDDLSRVIGSPEGPPPRAEERADPPQVAL